jgi:hypothetical protein
LFVKYHILVFLLVVWWVKILIIVYWFDFVRFCWVQFYLVSVGLDMIDSLWFFLPTVSRFGCFFFYFSPQLVLISIGSTFFRANFATSLKFSKL